MFRTLASTSFKRSMHTASFTSTRPARLRAVLGASAVATSYLVWNSWYGQRIALDAASSASKQIPLTPKTAKSPEAISKSPSTAPEHEPSSHPDSPPPVSIDPTPDEAKTDGATEDEKPTDNGGGGGAFNPETGEINWDCPCLGGMAHGPCGMQFREAFSCFVFSEAEPKGIDCVEKFKAMQECFREHPDVYGDEIMRDDEEEEGFTLDAAPSLDPTLPSIPSSEEAAAIELQTEQSPSQTEAPVEEKKPRKTAPTSPP